VVGGQEQRLAEAGVAVFGRAADRVGEARGVLVGISPEKDRAAARLVNRRGSPSRPRIWAARIFPTPGTDSRMWSGSASQ
jgi:hypothetical protein